MTLVFFRVTWVLEERREMRKRGKKKRGEQGDGGKELKERSRLATT